MKYSVFTVMSVLFSFSAQASDHLNVSCTFYKNGLSGFEEKTCALKLPLSAISAEGYSLREQSVLCNSSDYDLKLKLASGSGYFTRVDVEITREKKTLFGKVKTKSLGSDSVQVGNGVTSSVGLSRVTNGNGINCTVKTE